MTTYYINYKYKYSININKCTLIYIYYILKIYNQNINTHTK